MTREWIALYPAIMDTDRWADLSESERLGWLMTLMLAARQKPEGSFESVTALARMLRKEGLSDPPGVVGRLIEVGALEGGPPVAVHNWSKHQRRYRGPTDDLAFRALQERERYWRNQASGDRLGKSGEALGISGTEIEIEVDVDVEPTPPPPPPSDTTMSSGFVGAVSGEDRDALDAFYEMTGARPWGKDVGRWLAEIEHGYGREATIAAIQEEHRSSTDRRTLVSRVEARLGREAERKKQARPKPKPNGVDPEMAARQREELARMIGKEKG